MWPALLLGCVAPAEPPPSVAPAPARTDPWRSACVGAPGSDDTALLRVRAALRRPPPAEPAPPGLPEDGPLAEARSFLTVDGGALAFRDQGPDGGGVWFVPTDGEPVALSGHQVVRALRLGAEVWAVEGRAEAFHQEGRLVRFSRRGAAWEVTEVADLGGAPLAAMPAEDGDAIWVELVGGLLLSVGLDGRREVRAGEVCVLAYDPCPVEPERCTPLDPEALAALEVVRDRAAGTADAWAGRAVFVASGDARPSDRPRPVRVRYDDGGGLREAFLLQAEWIGPLEVLGLEHADGTTTVVGPDALR